MEVYRVKRRKAIHTSDIKLSATKTKFGEVAMTAITHILIIADDRETCAHMANILSTKEWRTDTAWIGSKALELARKNQYDAIVFDYRKPGLDGAEVCRLVEKAQPTANKVFVTGRPNNDTVYRAVEAGAERVLAKPVAPTELVHVLEKQLAGIP